jgi:multidrug efflux pump subunit AcrA (membrane-fusion protein)
VPLTPSVPRSRIILLAAAAAVVVLAAAGLVFRNGSGKPKYLTMPVKRGPLTATVEATGTINPLTTVPVGSSVSGTVKYIFADFNSRVRAGQVLAQLDPQIFEAQVVTARGNLKNLEAAEDVAGAAIQVSEANVAKLQADLGYARSSARRIADLNTQGLVPRIRGISPSRASRSRRRRCARRRRRSSRRERSFSRRARRSKP